MYMRDNRICVPHFYFLNTVAHAITVIFTEYKFKYDLGRV